MFKDSNDLEIYKNIVNSMSAGVWICDKNKKTIYVNESLLKLLGYKDIQINKTSAKNLWDENTNNIIQEHIDSKDEIKNKKTISKIETQMGNLIPVSVRWNNIPGQGTIAVIKDLRELNTLKEAEEKLKKSNTAKDEFISIVGHELRTPLTSIRGYLSMILDGDMGEVNTSMKKALSHTYNSSVRMIQLVNDILTLGKMESGKMEYYMENVPVGPILHSIAHDVEMEIKSRDIEFKLDLDPQIENIHVYIDENKLKQVFLNLITNAIKFTHSGGSITLKAGIYKNSIRFEVIDTGEGIPEDKLDILFQKFSQVESHLQRQNTSGLGLGLAIVKSFLDEFLSEVQVKSILGEGSNFYFDLKIVK